MPEYNPNSSDAQFASIHTTLGSQNVMLFQILDETRRTNGRVTHLETQMEGRWKYLMGGAAAVTVLGGAVFAFIEHFLK